jgi:hypothetical protein
MSLRLPQYRVDQDFCPRKQANSCELISLPASPQSRPPLLLTLRQALFTLTPSRAPQSGVSMTSGGTIAVPSSSNSMLHVCDTKRGSRDEHRAYVTTTPNPLSKVIAKDVVLHSAQSLFFRVGESRLLLCATVALFSWARSARPLHSVPIRH